MRSMSWVVAAALAFTVAAPIDAEACGAALRVARGRVISDPRIEAAISAIDDGEPALALKLAARIRDRASRKRVEGLARHAQGRHAKAVLSLDEALLRGLHDRRLLTALAESLEATGKTDRAAGVRARLDRTVDVVAVAPDHELLGFGMPSFPTILMPPDGAALTAPVTTPAPVVIEPAASPTQAAPTPDAVPIVLAEPIARTSLDAPAVDLTPSSPDLPRIAAPEVPALDQVRQMPSIRPVISAP